MDTRCPGVQLYHLVSGGDKYGDLVGLEADLLAL